MATHLSLPPALRRELTEVISGEVRLQPSLVSEYSTRTGTSGKISRLTSPSRSMLRHRLADDLLRAVAQRRVVVAHALVVVPERCESALHPDEAGAVAFAALIAVIRVA